MKKTILGIMLLGSFSSFAAGYSCRVTENNKNHLTLKELLVSPELTDGLSSVIVGTFKVKAYYYNERF